MIILVDAIIYGSVLAVLCVGLTLTYKITNVPNFAHTTFAILGMYMGLIVVRIFDSNPFVALPIAFALSGAVALFLYYGILRILIKKGSTYLSLIIATLSFDILMVGVMNILADYLFQTFKIVSRDFTLRSYDIVIDGTPMVLIVSIVILGGLIVGLYYLLYQTRFGMSMRASIDNTHLAGSFGIDTNKVFAFSWFLSGGLGGIAGVLMSVWFQGDPSLSVIMLPSVFAGSIVGGFSSIYGAIIGGLIIGFSEILGTSVLANVLGYWVIPYRPIIPFLFIIFTLLLFPKGISVIFEKLWARVRK